MSGSTDYIVMGAGVVGLCAAIAMRQRGHSVVVLEAGHLKADETDATSRLFAINQASQTLFQSLGVWDLMDATRVAIYKHMHVWDAQGRACIDFDAKILARDRLGVMIEESVIKAALMQRAQALEIELWPNQQAQAMDSQVSEIMVRTADRTWRGQFLIVADGARSIARSLLKVPMVTWPYHQDAIVAKVSTGIPHDRTAFQVFSQTGPLAFLPMTAPQECSIVWSNTSARSQSLMALSDADFEKELAESFQNKLGHITLLSKRSVFPLKMQHVKRYVGPRWVMMGDAAHTVHPLAGLGLNLGLADVTMFLRQMPANGHCFPSMRKMNAFQRERKHALWQVILLLQAIHLLFTQSQPFIHALGSIGLQLCNRLPGVKRMFIEHAMGLD